MTEDQFTKVFKTLMDVSKDVAAIKETMATKTQVNAVYDLLDKNITEHQRQEEERAAMASQLTRLERWVKEIADKTGVTLKYE